MPAERNGVRALTHRKWWKSGLRYRFVVVIGRLGGQVGGAGQPSRTGWCSCEGTSLGRIDIHRSQIMAAARWTKPVKWMMRRS
jgi:hypothetical protein